VLRLCMRPADSQWTLCWEDARTAPAPAPRPEPTFTVFALDLAAEQAAPARALSSGAVGEGWAGVDAPAAADGVGAIRAAAGGWADEVAAVLRDLTRLYEPDAPDGAAPGAAPAAPVDASVPGAAAAAACSALRVRVWRPAPPAVRARAEA
jgi:hypothetical protein